GTLGYHAAVRAPDTDAIVARLPDLVNVDDALVRRGERLTTTFLLAVDDAVPGTRSLRAPGRGGARTLPPPLMELRRASVGPRVDPLLGTAARAGIPRPLRDEEARRGARGGRPLAPDGAPPLRQGRARGASSRPIDGVTACSSRSWGVISTSCWRGGPTACTSRRRGRAGRSSASTPRAPTDASSGT